MTEGGAGMTERGAGMTERGAGMTERGAGMTGSDETAGSAGIAGSAEMAGSAGTTGSAETAGSAEMAVRARVAPEKGNSSPGNANLRIATQAGHDDNGHSDSLRKYVPRHASSISPTHDAVIAPFRRYVHLPAPLLFSPVIPASPSSFLRRQES
jgi:hypothetical protein